jgi:hypothetical protein
MLPKVFNEDSRQSSKGDPLLPSLAYIRAGISLDALLIQMVDRITW